jgi:hypothetical protein
VRRLGAVGKLRRFDFAETVDSAVFLDDFELQTFVLAITEAADRHLPRVGILAATSLTGSPFHARDYTAVEILIRNY